MLEADKYLETVRHGRLLGELGYIDKKKKKRFSLFQKLPYSGLSNRNFKQEL